MGKNDNIRELGSNVTEYSNQIVRINTKCDLNKASIDEEMKNKNIHLSNKAEVKKKKVCIVKWYI